MRTVLSLLSVTAFLVAACGGESSPAAPGAPDGGGPGGSGPVSGDPDAGPVVPIDGLRLTWLVQELTGDENAPIVEGVEVCVLEHAEIPCATTDADGRFELRGFRGDSVYDLTLRKKGYLSTLKTIETANIDLDATGTPPVPLVPEQAPPTDLGFTVDRSKAGIGFFAVTVDGDQVVELPGTRVSISPQEGNGPVYYGLGPDTYDPTATATFSIGGNFFNLEKGEYEVRFAPPDGYDCTGISFPFSGWGLPVAGQPAVIVHTEPGYYSGAVGVLCTPSLAPPAGG